MKSLIATQLKILPFHYTCTPNGKVMEVRAYYTFYNNAII